MVKLNSFYCLQVFQEEMGVVKSYNLKPGGDKIPVTKQNRKGESEQNQNSSAVNNTNHQLTFGSNRVFTFNKLIPLKTHLFKLNVNMVSNYISLRVQLPEPSTLFEEFMMYLFTVSLSNGSQIYVYKQEKKLTSNMSDIVSYPLV